jgi:hypothetical protein
MEAAGEVTAVGAGVSALKVGDRVAYVARAPGAYAQERVLRADQVTFDRNTGIAAQFLVALKVARISAEILAWPELSGVYEDADYGDVALRPACLDQREVTVMQIPHCRNEPDPFFGLASHCESAA